MDGVTAMLVFVVVLAVAFDYTNGFHDTANSIATSVATRALSPGWAILMATSFNFIGAFAGTAVAKTIGSGLVNDQTTTQAIVAAALIGAIAWNLITWQQGLPSSSSHALIGGLLGATIIGAGVGALNINGIVNKVLIPMFTSPVLGFVIAFAFILAIYWIFRSLEAQADGAALPPPPGLLGRVHGLRPRLERCPEDDGHHHPGPLLGGRHPGGHRAVVGHHRVGDGAVAGDRRRWLADHEDDGPARREARAGPRLRGRDDGRLDPVRDRPLGMPVSTTQVISSAIMGVGASQGARRVRWGVARRILIAWILTIPAAGILAALAWVVLNALGAP